MANLYFLILAIIAYTLTSCQIDELDKDVTIVFKDLSITDEKYKLEFYEDQIAAGAVVRIVVEGFIMVKDGAIFIDNKNMPRGTILSLSDTVDVLADNGGCILWRWHLAEENKPQNNFMSGFYKNPPISVNLHQSGPSMESTLFSSVSVGSLEPYISDNALTLRMERITLNSSTIINTFTRPGPSISVMVFGDMKINLQGRSDEIIDAAGNSWYEEAKSSANYITYQASEVMTVTLLPGNQNGKLVDNSAFINKSTGKKKGQQHLVMDKIMTIKSSE